MSYAEVPLGWRGRGRHGGIGLLWPVCWSVCRLAKLPRAGPRTGSANRQSGSAALTPGATAHHSLTAPTRSFLICARERQRKRFRRVLGGTGEGP